MPDDSPSDSRRTITSKVSGGSFDSKNNDDSIKSKISSSGSFDSKNNDDSIKSTSKISFGGSFDRKNNDDSIKSA